MPPTRTSAATKVLVVVAVVTLATFVASDRLLVHSASFWELVRKGVVGMEHRPLEIEAQLRLLSPGQARLVFIGSSTARQDIEPKILEERLKLSSSQIVRLALGLSNAVELAMLTPQLVQLRPDAVVYLVSPWLLVETLDLNDLRFYHPRFAVELFGWRDLLIHHEDFASRLLESGNVLLRHRQSLRAQLTDAIWEPQEALPSPTRRILERRLRFGAVRRGDFTCECLQTRALTLMAGHLQEAGIELVTISTPSRNRWHGTAVVETADACFAELSRTAGFRYISSDSLPAFEDSDFNDPFHLNTAGRARLTDALAPQLRPLLGTR